ncbi:MAG: 50S ribosomal protein L21 [Candidatus Pelagibacterales bacterium]|jgi:large subunit ribosomal protein L21|tara:strand:+ start:2823 stop:3248 length:426 start_codon:yes stop_codon:yes gene_type:complete
MFAIISSGGKQYKVSENTILTVNKLSGTAGDHVEISDVLFASDGKEFSVGEPLIDGAKVNLEIIKQDRDRKILIFKKKRRKNFRRKNGHRQDMTFLQVKSLNIPGFKPKTKAKSVEVDKASKEKTVKKSVVKKKTATSKDK